VLLAVSGLGVIYLMLVDTKIRTMTLTRRLVQLILLYVAVQIIWGLVAFHRHDVNEKALGYGWIVDLRLFLFFLIVWAVALRTARLHSQWRKLVLWPAAIVVVFGILQVFVLPKDFLAHFGYGPATISPYETINHNSHYIRIASTLRGANPLGAYLIVPISALTVLIIRGRRNWQTISLFVGSLIVLFFSFSRSAWIGAAISIVAVVLIGTRSKTLRKILLYICAGLIVVAAIITISLRNNARFENIVFHTQAHSQESQSSDKGHASALAGGIHQVIHEPLGRGPGSAGPASEYNNHPARIAENFYIQIGQETGWLGLLLFVTINAGVGYLLWLGRKSSLALALFASLLGLSLVNMLSHAWADDTLAYVWWGLAGIAIATLPHTPADIDELAERPSKKAKKKRVLLEAR
jgi:O-antigen ligase